MLCLYPSVWLSSLSKLFFFPGLSYTSAACQSTCLSYHFLHVRIFFVFTFFNCLSAWCLLRSRSHSFLLSPVLLASPPSPLPFYFPSDISHAHRVASPACLPHYLSVCLVICVLASNMSPNQPTNQHAFRLSVFQLLSAYSSFIFFPRLSVRLSVCVWGGVGGQLR